MSSNGRIISLFWKNLYWYYRWGLVFGIALSLLLRRSNMVLIFVFLSGALNPNGYLENSRYIRDAVRSRQQLSHCLTYFVTILLIGCLVIYFATAFILNQTVASVLADIRVAAILSAVII